MSKKIIFIASYPFSLLNFRLSLMQSFIGLGYKVIALAPYDRDVSIKLKSFDIELIPINMERNGLNPISDIKLILQMWRVLNREKPDAIFSYTIKPVIYGSIAGWLSGVPNIYAMITGTGYVFNNNNLKSILVGAIARTLFKMSLQLNRVIYFQNKDNLEFFKSINLIRHDKSTAVINGSGVDCHYYEPTSYPEPITFLLIARLLQQKGIREYAEAAKRIRIHYPHVKCCLVGWIDTNPDSITQAELDQWINSGDIEYLGKLDDVRPAIADSSVYVLPSYHEGTPRSVLEAMAMARPIITTDAPGCRETVIPSYNGFLIPVKNVDALYEAMEFFIKNPAQIPIMGQASRSMALDKYDVHKVNESILRAMQLQPAN